MANNEAVMKEAFEKIGKKYGYDRVGTEFVAYRDFKVKWTRSYKWAEFQVSDYLMDAPKEVFEGLADTLFSRITGLEPKPYSKEMTEYITSEEFTRTKQPVYLKRSRNISRSPVGEHKNLTESLQRLKDLGLVPKDANPYMTWTKEELASTVGYSSTLMDVIVISSAFDSDYIPDQALDFAVYHEFLVTREGWANFGKADPIDVVEEEKKFPDYKDAEGWIRKMCLHL